MGYHRLWSHHAFTARKSLRVALALMGALGFQGSIRVRVSHFLTPSILNMIQHVSSGGLYATDCITGPFLLLLLAYSTYLSSIN